MNILCITHADFETPGIILEWANQNAHKIKIIKPYKNENFSLNDNRYDFLIVMGGPQDANDLEKFPYLKEEIELIKKFSLENKKILGICLGAQLIGKSFGENAEKSPEKEVGVYPIQLTNEAKNDPLLKDFPNTFLAIHWHNDMPGIKNDSTILASSEGCPRQIIKFAKNIYGFQCHLEITSDGIIEMINAAPQDLSPSSFTQSKETLITQNYKSINNTMMSILDKFSEI